MSAAPIRWSVPRIIHNQLTKRLRGMNYQQSPHNILSQFPESTRLTVKQSISANRFFMYEEQTPVKIQDDDPMTPTMSTSPMKLADMLSNPSKDHHYYWTSPITTVAPNLLQQEFDWYQQLHDEDDDSNLDPRGPSLWMGTSGSGTQCHYDVANNVILQLYGSKRIRCFPPHVGITHFHVFPDAHPRARKSQVDFDLLYDTNKNLQSEEYSHFTEAPSPFLDIVLKPGDAVEIPAFWFHHVENGYVDDEPSVSLNSFVLSEPMMIAQQVFQKASQPLRYGQTTCTKEQVPAVLRELGVTLIQKLGLVKNDAAAVEFIRRNLVEARFAPLNMLDKENITSSNMSTLGLSATAEQQQAITACVNTLLSDFEDLVMEEFDGSSQEMERNGIVLLVALHLLELWAVQLVGGGAVHDAWSEALV